MTMPLDTIGLDLHKREIQICTLTAGGELIERWIATTRARFTEGPGNRPGPAFPSRPRPRRLAYLDSRLRR